MTILSEFSKQVKQKVSERRLAVGGLEEEVEYRFTVRAVTVGPGPGTEARARTGPQPGSPEAPASLNLTPDPAALHLHWRNSASGKGPLLGYYIEAKKKGIYYFLQITVFLLCVFKYVNMYRVNIVIYFYVHVYY